MSKLFTTPKGNNPKHNPSVRRRRPEYSIKEAPEEGTPRREFGVRSDRARVLRFVGFRIHKKSQSASKYSNR